MAEKRLAVLGSCLLGLSVVRPSPAQQVNPYEGDPVALRAGQSLFAARCADCHGPDGKGKVGPNLTLRWAMGQTDESTFYVIRDGVIGSVMPPSTAPDSELWAIVAYLRSMSVMPDLITTGDSQAGQALFDSECSSCHRVGSRGGALGPDLTQIGQLRPREALVESIREPSAQVTKGFRAVTFRSGGHRVEGVVKGEDAFSIQIMTADGRLQGYSKAALGTIEPLSDSLMPRYAPEQLSDSDLENLLAYLGRLRDDRRDDH